MDPLPIRRHLPRAAGRATARGVEGDVVELTVLANSTEHQAAAGHVAESCKGGGKSKPRTEDGQKDVDVLSGSDASQEHDVCVTVDPSGHAQRVTLERLPVAPLRC